MRRILLLIWISLTLFPVFSQKKLYIFRNNATINTFNVPEVDSIKFSNNQTVMDVYKNNFSVTKIQVTTVDSMMYSDYSLPTVELTSATYNYSTSKATCVVNVKSNGGCSLVERGICWSTAKNPTVKDRKASSGVSTGQFYILTGVLALDSTYYIRPFAKNCVGISYGNEMIVKPTTGNLTFTMGIDSVAFPTQYKLIKQAMDSACYYYNRYTTFKGNIYVYYNSGIPTAQASYHGSIGFGPDLNYMWVGTAMHEVAHFVGSGTTNAWKALLSGGIWQGAKGKEVIASFGTGEVLKGDNNSNPIHFWPYGINYRSEVKSATDLIRHAQLVQAMVVDDAKVPNTW